MNDKSDKIEMKRLANGVTEEDTPMLLGESEALRGVRKLIEQVAAIDVPVLIIGESGTGKEVAARMIHHHSLRRKENFVPVNCGAIPEGLFESEMFGTVRGAYTGADRSRPGLFEQADRGTLLLDEIGEMPLAMQVKLLRVLESGMVTRLGGSDPIHVDFRLISSTNRDLANSTTEEKFRLDLYYRVRAVQIELPPLRERPEDIPTLIQWFTRQFVKRNRIEAREWSPAVLNWLSEQRWEGNVRELHWFVEGFLSLDRLPGVITLDRLQPIYTQLVPSSKRLPVLLSRKDFLPYESYEPTPLGDNPIGRELNELRREVHELKGMVATALLRQEEYRTAQTAPEKAIPVFPTVRERELDAAKEALRESNGNRREAAKKLGISERTLYRKLREFE